MPINYQAVTDALRQQLGSQAVSDDPVRRFAWSTDASYFRIVPAVVVHAESPEDVRKTLSVAHQYKAPVTFRAAGTSLSGQAIGEGILVMLGFDGFRGISIRDDAREVSLGVAVIGADANAALKPFDKKIGPDPATLACAMIGGIVSNNSSGMCCGTAQNSYQTIKSLKLVLADGTELDTGDEDSREAFRRSHAALLNGLADLGAMARNNSELAARIRHKYQIKNTTGYSLNALIDYEDPFDVLNHILVGSEGTLAFVDEVTYHTVDEARFKASALAVFYDMEEASRTIPPLKCESVAAAELLDWASIKAVTGKPGMPTWIANLPEGAAILLIESRAGDADTLARYTADVIDKLQAFKTERPVEFTSDPAVYGEYWAMRSGLFPIIGGERPKGTSVIIEDIAVDVKHLAAAAHDLTTLFNEHGYPEGVIYGHALAGNYHFIITPRFETDADVTQFQHFMEAVVDMVLNKYDGSMKAEHGTGRAVAPFVETEWGHEAYVLMQQLKQLFDPENLLNPGVILNNDKTVYIKNIKPSPIVDDLVDRCIECGFCEKTCPTSALNMSPRHRITTLREIARLDAAGDTEAAQKMRQSAQYDVIDTCTACQLCTIACPVDNSMGELVRKLRTPGITSTQQKVLDFQAKHWAAVNTTISGGFNALNLFHHVAGDGVTQGVMNVARKLSSQVPVWNPDFPQGGALPEPTASIPARPEVVYFAACGGRTFGATPLDEDKRALGPVVVTLLERAGYNVIVPDNTRSLCCGQMWESKGDFKNAEYKRNELINTLRELTHGGELPVIIDALSCTASALQKEPDFRLIDLTDFLHDDVMPKLTLHKKSHIALHLGCSARKLHIEGKMEAIANACSEKVFLPSGITCCGYAGEKGLYKPEINAKALRNLKQLLPSDVHEGYYANRMCEVGLSHHSGISYRNLAYLLEECSR